jgi:ferredoxin
MKRRPIQLPAIDLKRCTGCGWCVAACPLDLLTLERAGWKKHSQLHDAGRCTGCAYCAIRCPFGAITMRAAADASEADGAGQPGGQPG